MDVKKTAVYGHVEGHPDCCQSYSDSSFTMLCLASHTRIMQLNVLEAIFIHLHKPALCALKESVVTLKLFTKQYGACDCDECDKIQSIASAAMKVSLPQCHPQNTLASFSTTT